MPSRVTGVAVYTACAVCAAEHMPSAREFAPGWFLAAGHAEHADVLVALGWTVSYADGPAEPPDVFCPHAVEADP
jgi:hypothetical protein